MRGYNEVEVRQGDESFDAFEDAVPVAVELPRIAEWLIGFVHLRGKHKRPCERALVQQRGDVGAQDGRVRGEGSGQVAVTLGVGEGQELQFLDRLVDRAIGATSAIGAAHQLHNSVVSVQVVSTAHAAVLLIIRRS